MNDLARRAATGTLLLTLAACSGGAGGLQSGFTPPATAASHRAYAHSTQLVYVSSDQSSNGAIYVYSAKGQAQQPIATITDGIATPAGLAVDASGSLYVANTGNNTVTVYPPGQTTPATTYSQGVSTPFDVAVGKDGTVYVANETGGASYTGSVTEYPAGSTTPTATLQVANEYAFAVALDSSNALYVSWFSLSSFGVEIYKYPAEGSTGGTNLNLDLPTYAFPAYCLAFDRSGNLVVPYERLDHNPPKYLAVFAPGATEPKKKINMGGLMDVVAGLAFPSSGKLFYVATENDHEWLKLTYPKAIPRDVVNVGSPAGLALSP
jgi:NHL repeat